jgi:AcrR family transcriptional regulator
MINYYFGSWDGLLAEAVFYAYDEWYRTQRAALARPAKSPRERFRRVIEDEIDRGRRLGGVLPLSAYPVLSETVSELLDNDPRQKVQRITEWSVLATAQLIRDLRTGTMTPIEFTTENMSRVKMMASMPKELFAAASAQWSISGMVLWASSGTHAGRGVADLPQAFSENLAMKAHIERLLDSFEQNA